MHQSDAGVELAPAFLDRRGDLLQKLLPAAGGDRLRQRGE
jgi:hypothetical protein